MIEKQDAQELIKHIKNTLTEIAKDSAEFTSFPTNKWACERSGKSTKGRYAWFVIYSTETADIKDLFNMIYDYYEKHGFKIRRTSSSEQL